MSSAKPVSYIGDPMSEWDEIEKLSMLEKMRFGIYRLMLKFSHNEKQEIKNTDASNMNETQFMLPQLNLKRAEKTPRTGSMSHRFQAKTSLDTASYHIGSRVSSIDMMNTDFRKLSHVLYQ